MEISAEKTKLMTIGQMASRGVGVKVEGQKLGTVASYKLGACVSDD